MVEWWGALDVQIKAAIIAATTTVLAAGVAAVVIFYQIGRQLRDAIDQNRRNEALKLKLQIYQEIVEICREATLADVRLVTLVGMLPNVLNTARQLQRTDPPSKYRTSVLIDVQDSATMTLVDVISWIERWGIVDPRIDVFWWAVNSAKHEIAEACRPYAHLAMRILPQEVPPGYPGEGTQLPWTPPDQNLTGELERLGEPILEALSTSGGYIFDLQLEMQNLLLGDLFEHRVVPRQPIDPRFRSIRLDQREELIRHFSEETAWGRLKAGYEEAAAQHQQDVQ